MLVENIKWKPVRLEIRRLKSNEYEVHRDGELRGWVLRTEHGWETRGPKERVSFMINRVSSFRAGALRLCRHQMLYLDSDGIQDFGLLRVRRVGVSGMYFTIITDPQGRYYPDIFLDMQDRIRKPSDRMQARLRKAINAFDEHTRSGKRK